MYFSVKKERDWRLDDSPEAFAGAKDVLSRPFYKARPDAIARLSGLFHQNYAAYRKGSLPAVAATSKNIDVKRIGRDSSGKLDWSGVATVKVDGKNGLSGGIRLGWDAERLYVKADIKNKYPLTNKQKDDVIWNGDCVELCISTDPKADPSRLTIQRSPCRPGPGSGASLGPRCRGPRSIPSRPKGQ